MSEIQQDSGIKFYCSYCDKYYFSHAVLSRHHRQAHQNSVQLTNSDSQVIIPATVPENVPMTVRSQVVSQAVPTVSEMPTSVLEWLKECEVDQYASVLFENGFDSFTAIRLLDENYLDKLEITKLGHRAILMQAVKDLKNRVIKTQLTKSPTNTTQRLQKKTIPSVPVDALIIIIRYQITSQCRPKDIKYYIKQNTGIGAIMAKFCTALNLSVSKYRFSFDGSYLDTRRFAKDYQMQNGDIIDCQPSISNDYIDIPSIKRNHIENK
jgi:hypothetical protein